MNYSYNEMMKIIKKKNYCDSYVNPSKTGGIFKVGCNYNDGTSQLGIYVDFKFKKTMLVSDKGTFAGHWLNDKVAVIDSSCGTGCSNEVILIAPDILISCSEYELNDPDPLPDDPKPRSRRPLLIDPEKEIYVCYDQANHIQVFPFPKQSTITPPKGFTASHAEINGKHLNILYENDKEEVILDSYLLAK